MPKFKRTYSQRGYVSRRGCARLNQVLGECAELYNAELELWRKQYQERGEGESLYDRYKDFTLTRYSDDFWKSISVHVGRGVLRRADQAKNSFHRRVKAGDKPGYPRFKPRNRYRTIGLEQVASGMIRPDSRGYAIRIKGLPLIRLRTKVKLPSAEDLKCIRITFKGRRIGISLVYAVEIKPLTHSPAKVGLDMGVISRIATSDGGRIERRRVDWVDLVRKQQRLSACKKGSREFIKRRRVLANAHDRARIRDRNLCHRITTNLVRHYGYIALEKLDVKKMTKSGGRRKSGLNRSIYEQSWGRIASQLVYKAESAGRKLVFVNPRFTSQLCSCCGARVKKSRKKRTHRCGCGAVLDRDHNAAINILNKALGGGVFPPAACEAA